MDQLPFVTEVYKRDLRIEDYFIGYLMHPYISIYTGPRLQIPLHLLPVAADRRRPQLPHPLGENVVEEIRRAKEYFPQVKEFFFDDDTFTDNLPRAEAIARELGKLGVTWSLQRQGQRALRDAEGAARTTACACCWSAMRAATSRSCTTSRRACASRSRSSSPRTATSSASRSTAPSSSACPARPRRRSRRPSSSPRRSTRTPSRCRWPRPIPAPSCIDQAVKKGWLDVEHAELIDEHGVQIAPLHYPHLTHTEIFEAVETFYRRFYFRPSKIVSILGEMIRSPQMMKRRLREGVEFFQFLRERRAA